jgi:hypothetical protein
MEHEIVPFGNKRLRGYLAALLRAHKDGLSLELIEPEPIEYFKALIPYDSNSLELSDSEDVLWHGLPISEIDGTPPVFTVERSEKGYCVTFTVYPSINTIQGLKLKKCPDEYSHLLYSLGFREIECSYPAYRRAYISSKEKKEMEQKYFSSLKINLNYLSPEEIEELMD